MGHFGALRRKLFLVHQTYIAQDREVPSIDLTVALKNIPRVSNIYASKYSMCKQNMPQNIPCVSKIFTSDWSEIINIIQRVSVNTPADE